jgi:acyl-coenzyme A synthetase/AMP-(fatty) acid ligase
MPDTEQAIWSREGCYTWKEVYAQSNRYSQFLLSQGVQKRDIVGFYLTNSPEFMFATLGVWAIGCAPAMVNHHLAGDALVHCIKLAGTKLLIVDWDDACRARVEDCRARIEEAGIKIFILDDALKAHINSLEPIRPPNEFRDNMNPTYPMGLIYTR